MTGSASDSSTETDFTDATQTFAPRDRFKRPPLRDLHFTESNEHRPGTCEVELRVGDDH